MERFITLLGLFPLFAVLVGYCIMFPQLLPKLAAIVMTAARSALHIL